MRSGVQNANEKATTQLDREDKPYVHLPMNPQQRDIPLDLPNKPFDLSLYVNVTTPTIDLTHSFYTEQAQINGGAMNKFATFSSAKGLAMSYYDARNLYLGQLGLNYTVFDQWFHAGFGGSFFNHQFLVTVNIPVYPNCPEKLKNKLDDKGRLVNPDAHEVPCTPDNYAVNTIQPFYPPYRANTSESDRLPPQTAATIGDLLRDAGVSWAWYSGGWNDAVAGNPDATFQYHHQPFNYYANFAPGTPGRVYLKDEVDLLNDLKNGTLPSVAFYKPLGKYNYHPDYSIVAGEAEAKLKEIVEAIQNSRYWSNAVVFVTFDEHGGRWDHVAPPTVDRFGPGIRIPTVMVSPFAKKGFVDSTVRDSTAIMKFIEDRFNLKSLGARDAAQPSFDNVFVQEGNAKLWIALGIIVAGLWLVVFAIGAGILISNAIRKKRSAQYQDMDNSNSEAQYYRS
jgi:phospholipase C